MLWTKIRDGALKLTPNVFHFSPEENPTVPYLVYAEDSTSDFYADGKHSEKGLEGTLDLYTQSDVDPLYAQVEEMLEKVACTWYLNSVSNEDETGLIHYEWVWTVV